jgi:hypothetical protein
MERSCKRSGMANGCNAEKSGTNSGKRSRSNFKNERITINILLFLKLVNQEIFKTLNKRNNVC